jgi:hypothetical protein
MLTTLKPIFRARMPSQTLLLYHRHGVEIAIRLTPPTTAVGAQDNLIRRLEPRDNGYTPVEKPF